MDAEHVLIKPAGHTRSVAPVNVNHENVLLDLYQQYIKDCAALPLLPHPSEFWERVQGLTCGISASEEEIEAFLLHPSVKKDIFQRQLLPGPFVSALFQNSKRPIFWYAHESPIRLIGFENTACFINTSILSGFAVPYQEGVFVNHGEIKEETCFENKGIAINFNTRTESLETGINLCYPGVNINAAIKRNDSSMGVTYELYYAYDHRFIPLRARGALHQYLDELCTVTRHAKEDVLARYGDNPTAQITNDIRSLIKRQERGEFE